MTADDESKRNVNQGGRPAPARSGVLAALACFGVVLVSLAMVVVYFYVSAIPRHFEPSGYPRELPAIGRAYMEIIAFVYGPVSSVVGMAYDRLPVMGWVTSFASITTAVTLQNLLFWFGGRLLLRGRPVRAAHFGRSHV
jgi:hypothetical protein